jgi:FolB domain-containing protein
MSNLVKNNLDRISLKGGVVDCIIGVLPNERTTKQKLNFEISMYLDIRLAAQKCDLYHSSDYAFVKSLIERLLEEGEFGLLETAAEAIAHLLLEETFASQIGNPDLIEIVLSKPNAFDDLCLPSVSIARRSEDLQEDLGPDEIYKCADLIIVTDESRGFSVLLSN